MHIHATVVLTVTPLSYYWVEWVVVIDGFRSYILSIEFAPHTIRGYESYLCYVSSLTIGYHEHSGRVPSL